MIRYKDFSRIVLLAALVALPACASRPAPRIFVLDPPGGAPTGIVSLRDRPQVALLAVQVPDYLDTTDILTRGTGHEIVASDSARWGERLSVGVTHAVLSALQARRQDLGIAPADSIDNRPRRLLVQIDALDLWSDGRCTLTARWSLLDHDGETVLVSLASSFSIPAAATTTIGEGGLVEAVSRAIADLAQAIAVSLPKA